MLINPKLCELFFVCLCIKFCRSRSYPTDSTEYCFKSSTICRTSTKTRVYKRDANVKTRFVFIDVEMKASLKLVCGWFHLNYLISVHRSAFYLRVFSELSLYIYYFILSVCFSFSVVQHTFFDE